MDGHVLVNGERQKSSGELLSEVAATLALSGLANGFGDDDAAGPYSV